MNGFRQLAYAAPPLLLAIATFWLNRDGLERQRSIARTESRRSISVWGFKANGPYVDEPRVLLARNRGAGTPFLLTADSRRPAADERAVLEAMSWEAAPDAVGFGPAAGAPENALLVVPSDCRTASTRASLVRDGWMLADREGGTEAWMKQASGDGFYWEPDELAAAVETERASSAPAPFLGGTVRNALAEAFALLCLLLPLAVGWRRAGEAGIVVALAAETAVPAAFLAFGLGNAACAFAVPFAALAAAMSVRGPTRPREQFSMVAAGLLFATCAACVLTHTLFATNGLGTIGGKAKILHLCAGVPEGFFRDPNRAVLQPAYPPGFPLLAYAFFCLEGGASQWLVQLVPCAAQAFCLLLLCRSAPSRIWIPFLAAVFLSDPALCLTTMFYAEPLACVFLLCGWNLLEEGRTRQGWLALGLTAWIKNEFVLFPVLVWFVRRVLLRDCRCRIEHAIAALVPFVAWFIVSRALGAELYDYAPPWSPDPTRMRVAMAEILRLAFAEPWRYGWAWPVGAAALVVWTGACFAKRRLPDAIRRFAVAGVVLLACAFAFSYFLGLSRAPDFRWHCRSLYRLLFPPALLAIRIAFGFREKVQLSWWQRYVGTIIPLGYTPLDRPRRLTALH